MKTRAIMMAAGVALSVATISSANAAELLVNGSFETGDFSGWTESGNLGFTSVQPSGTGGYSAEDGEYFVYAGAIGSDNFLSQTFSDVAGATYVASGYMASNGTTPSEFDMEVNGTPYIMIVNSQTLPYTYFSFSFTGSGSDTFTVSSRDDPSFIAFDNFSVMGPGVPEPATWALMLLGFGGLGAVVRGRRGSLAA